jgi:plasmid stability protein
MTNLIIHNLDDALLFQLKKRAWQQGLPFEESLRRVLSGCIDSDTDVVDALVPQPSDCNLSRGIGIRALALHS